MKRAILQEGLGSRIDKSATLPVHLQVRQRLLEVVSSMSLKPGDAIPSEVDIANALGVSRMTVNKAILGLVSEGWLVREKGRGTFLAEPLQAGIARCLVLVKQAALVGLRDDYYYGALYWGIREFFSDTDVRVDIAGLADGSQAAVSANAVVIGINPDESEAQLLAQLSDRGTPVVALGSSWESASLNAVDSDNILGAAQAVNHLVDLGHKKIAFVGAWRRDSNTVDRLKGFRFAMKARGLHPSEDLEIVGSEAGGLAPEDVEHLEEVLTGSDPVTAVVAAGPHLGMYVLGVASKLGIPVPASLSVVAYDDPRFISMTHPPLTTVRQPLEEMAFAACQIVTNSTGHPAGENSRVVLEPTLIIRQSTAPAPSIHHTYSSL